MKKLILILVASLAFMAFSCSTKNTTTFEESRLVPLYEAEDDAAELLEPTQLWHTDYDCICVLFGYGYNDADFVLAQKESLIKKYGDYHTGGRFLPLVYPDDFKKGARTYITELANILDGKDVSALVILGAPEKTHAAIARLQDSHGGTLPYPVISLFPQDEVLAMEDSADIVLDKMQKARINGMTAPEEEQNFVEDVPELLERAVYLADISESAFDKKAGLIQIVRTLAGNRKVTRYIDAQTNLPSINHFVID